MSQYDAELQVAPPESKRWPLAAVVWIDLVIIVVLVAVSTFAIQAIALFINARAQGISITELRAQGQAALFGAIGVRGVFLSTALQNLICVAIPLLRVGVIRREPPAEIGYTRSRLLINVAIGVGVGFLALGVNIVLGLLFTQVFGMRQDQAVQFGALLKPGDMFGQLLFALMAIVVAPIGEEALFRGYLFNAIRQGDSRNRLILAYILSAGLFASVHLLNVTQGQAALVVPIFAVGLLFAATMQLTGSIVPCIIAHAIHNSLSTLVLLLCVNTNLPGCPV